jgi:hypothetical protein
MTRNIIWEWVNNPGLECLFLEEKDSGVIANGITVAEFNGIIFKLNYKVECDSKWLFQKAVLDLESGQNKKHLSIRRTENGNWLVDEQARDDLKRCALIDIMASPFTNTLPIRNLNLKTNQAEIIKVAYIRIPDLEVSFVQQKYTRLDPAEPPTRFLYQNVSNDFRAELTVDKDGIVVDYPNLWRQIITK